MNRQAWVAWLMVLLQAGLFWYLSDAIVFPMVIVAISLPAVLWRRRWEISSANLQWIDLGMAILCTMKWYLAPHDPKNIVGFVLYPLVHAAAQFFLLVQVARLWGRRPDRALPNYLPLLAVLVFICLGDVDVTRSQRRMYQHSTLALVGLACAFYSWSRKSQSSLIGRRYRWVRPTITLVVLMATVWGTRISNAWVLNQWGEIERYVLQATNIRRRPSQEDAYIGFSGSAPIGSVQLLKSHREFDVALRVISGQCPNYLRGAVFDRYVGVAWEYRPDWEPSVVMREPVSTSERSDHQSQHANDTSTNLFQLRPRSSNDATLMTVFREGEMERFTFLPLKTEALKVQSPRLALDRHGVVAAGSFSSSAVLTAWTPTTSQSPAEPITQPEKWSSSEPFELSTQNAEIARDRLCQLPDSIHPLVIERAASLFASCQTAREKVEAVRRYFANSKYQPSLSATNEQDPLTQFILERTSGHCEVFASATAILLRLGGVPCRYVTGFTGGDFNPIGRYWIVRQRNAHAWVEAYLPDTGWATVDNTPEEGLPAQNEHFGMWQLWDEVNLRGQMIRSVLANRSFRGTLTAIGLFLEMLVTTIPGWLLTGGVLFLVLRKIHFGPRKVRTLENSPEDFRLQSLRQELDRCLRRLQWEREPHETLHQFAARLSAASRVRPPLAAAADWYLKYAAARYDSLATDSLADGLNAELQELRLVVKRFRT